MLLTVVMFIVVPKKVPYIKRYDGCASFQSCRSNAIYLGDRFLMIHFGKPMSYTSLLFHISKLAKDISYLTLNSFLLLMLGDVRKETDAGEDSFVSNCTSVDVYLV